jgi:hypothetical protein
MALNKTLAPLTGEHRGYAYSINSTQAQIFSRDERVLEWNFPLNRDRYKREGIVIKFIDIIVDLNLDSN